MARPILSTNLAISADGKIAPVTRRASGWTSPRDHERLRQLRQGADALLVGRGTWQADRMTMTVRGATRQPRRCIVSRNGDLDPAHPMFSTPGGDIHLLVTGPPGAETPSGVTVHHCSLESFLETLHDRHGVRRLHCEGGGELIRELAALDFIDVFHLTWACHALFGGLKAPGPTGIPGDFLPASREFGLEHFEPDSASGECFLTYVRKRAAQ